ncbi:MAG TPA: MmcQ/YjbR family DNA-binding protein [Gaiellaceae bacterium]|nr:MmcQ/YjbR family DNA-binding protein [Gaiellaceae bacterium]
MKDLDALALALPEVTKEVDEGRPAYKVAGKTFCFHRSRRADALDPETGERLDDVLVFWVEDLEIKDILVDSGSGYFTTPHWNGYSAVLVRIPDLKKLRKAELRDRVEEAWLKRAPKKLATEWLAGR